MRSYILTVGLSQRSGRPLLAIAAAAQLSEEAERAALEADMPSAEAHTYPSGVQAGTLWRAVVLTERTPDLSLSAHHGLDRARQEANWMIRIQSAIRPPVTASPW